MFSEPQYLTHSGKESDESDVGLTDIDYEEQTAGYQTAYSRLAASEFSEVDCVGHIRNIQEFLGQQLVEFSKAYGPENAKVLINAADQSVVGPLMQALTATGYLS